MNLTQQVKAKLADYVYAATGKKIPSGDWNYDAYALIVEALGAKMPAKEDSASAEENAKVEKEEIPSKEELKSEVEEDEDVFSG